MQRPPLVAHGDIGAAADPWRAVANGLGGNGVHRRAVGLGRPDPEVGQDLLDDFVLHWVAILNMRRWKVSIKNMG